MHTSPVEVLAPCEGFSNMRMERTGSAGRSSSVRLASPESDDHMSENVTYKEMAKRLGVDPTTIRRLVERFGAELAVSVQKGRANTSNAKWTHYLSREDADRLAAFSETRHSRVDDPSAEVPLQRSGYFYVIQLVSEALPNRVKIGYTDNLEKRFAEHQTAAPTARLLSSWACKPSWDYAAMDSMTREGCSWGAERGLRGRSRGFLQRGNAFFGLMPKPDAERSSSAHSPLRQGEESDEGDA